MRHPLCITRHASPVMRHPSCVTRHAPPILCHPACVTRHASHAISRPLCVARHAPPAMRHASDTGWAVVSNNRSNTCRVDPPGSKSLLWSEEDPQTFPGPHATTVPASVVLCSCFLRGEGQPCLGPHRGSTRRWYGLGGVVPSRLVVAVYSARGSGHYTQ